VRREEGKVKNGEEKSLCILFRNMSRDPHNGLHQAVISVMEGQPSLKNKVFFMDATEDTLALSSSSLPFNYAENQP
jgi:hypothetical protein